MKNQQVGILISNYPLKCIKYNLYHMLCIQIYILDSHKRKSSPGFFLLSKVHVNKVGQTTLITQDRVLAGTAIIKILDKLVMYICTSQENTKGVRI